MGISGVDIHLSSFSRHIQPFRHLFGDGLDTYIIRLQAEGECEVLIGGKMVAVLPGDLLLFQPGELYELRIGEKESPLGFSADYYVMCTGEWVDSWWNKRTRAKKSRIAQDSKLHSVWQQLILEKRRPDGGSPEILEALFKALCLLLDRAVADAPAASSSSLLLGLKIKNYVEEHATSLIRLEDVARHAGISVTRAVHLFKDQFGYSVLQYAAQVRLAMALRMMDNSNYTLERIAEETGFGSYTYFHRVFRERYGVAPGMYRRRS